MRRKNKMAVFAVIVLGLTVSMCVFSGEKEEHVAFRY